MITNPGYDIDDDVELEDEDDGFGDCGLMPDGLCMQAGTEYCDFECLYRDEKR